LRRRLRSGQFENIHPVADSKSVAVRALAPITVNPTADRAFVAAAGAFPDGTPGPVRFHFLDSDGKLSPLGPKLHIPFTPGATDEYYQAHSIAQMPDGRFVVAGFARGGYGSHEGVNMMILNANLDHVENISLSASPPIGPGTKAVALPDGDVVLMLNKSGLPTPSAHLLFQHVPFLGTAGILNAYAMAGAPDCVDLRFMDMQEYNYKLYVVGYTVDPLFPNATESFLLEVNADPFDAQYGQALRMWKFPLGAPGTFASQFTTLTVKRDFFTNQPVIWAIGHHHSLVGQFTIDLTRIVKFDPIGETILQDSSSFFNRMRVPAGGAFVVDLPACTGWASTVAQLHLAGTVMFGSTNERAARHIRINTSNGNIETAEDYGYGGPPFTRFHAMVPFTPNGNVALMAGSHRGTATGLFDPFYVKTDCNGKTSCSVAQSLGVTLISGTQAQAVTPITVQSNRYCDDSPGPFPSFSVQLTIIPDFIQSTGTFTFVGCTDCDGEESSQSESPEEIEVGSAIACTSLTTTGHNAYARAFTAPAEGLSCGCVEFGIQGNTGGAWPATVRLLTGASVTGPIDELVELSSATIEIPPNSGPAFYTAVFPNGVIVPADTLLVVELSFASRLPADGGDGGSIFPGCNSAGQSAPTYLRSLSCGNPDFVDLASIGFPNSHLALTVQGVGASRPCPGDTNGDGTIDGADLAAVLGAWSTTNQAADLNGDGVVNGADLAMLLGNWGPCP